MERKEICLYALDPCPVCPNQSSPFSSIPEKVKHWCTFHEPLVSRRQCGCCTFTCDPMKELIDHYLLDHRKTTRPPFEDYDTDFANLSYQYARSHNVQISNPDFIDPAPYFLSKNSREKIKDYFDSRKFTEYNESILKKYISNMVPINVRKPRDMQAGRRRFVNRHYPARFSKNSHLETLQPSTSNIVDHLDQVLPSLGTAPSHPLFPIHSMPSSIQQNKGFFGSAAKSDFTLGEALSHETIHPGRTTHSEDFSPGTSSYYRQTSNAHSIDEPRRVERDESGSQQILSTMIEFMKQLKKPEHRDSSQEILEKTYELMMLAMTYLHKVLASHYNAPEYVEQCENRLLLQETLKKYELIRNEIMSTYISEATK